MTTSDYLSRYQTSPVKKDFQKDLFVKADDMVFTTSKSDKVELVVLLNSIQRTLSFYSLESISAFVNSLEKDSRKFLASSGYFISYVYNENTGRERLIRSHSSARFCFELSGNSN